MPSRAASTASIRHVWRRFRCNGRGSAAVEFALAAPVFFALLFAIIETAIMFFASHYAARCRLYAATPVALRFLSDDKPAPCQLSNVVTAGESCIAQIKRPR
jgi:hypothetical protein